MNGPERPARAWRWIVVAALVAGPLRAPAAGEPVPDAAPAGQPTAAPDAGIDPDAGSTRPVQAAPETITIVEEAPRPPPAAASEARLTARALTAAPRHSGDDLLRLVPGMFVTRHGAEGKGHQFFLRGFDAVHGADVEVRVAGIPLNELSNVHGQGYLDLGFLLPETVVEMVVGKGAYRLDQGNFATGGTVDLRLGVEAADRGERASLEVGTTRRLRALLLLAPARLPEETFLAAEAMRDDGFGQNRAARRLTLLGQARLWRRPGVGSLTLVGTAYGARFGEPGALPLAAFQDGGMEFGDTFSLDTHGASDRALVGVGLRGLGWPTTVDALVWVGGRRLDLRENFTGFLLHPEEGDRRLQAQDELGAGGRAEVRRHVGPALTLLAGAGWQGGAIDQHEDQIDANEAAFLRARDLDLVQQGIDARAGLRWRPVPWLRAEGGARLDVFRYDVKDRLQGGAAFADTVSLVSPRLALAAGLPRSVTLHAAYGRGLRAPEARSVVPGTRPDEDVSLEAYLGGEPRMTAADTGELGARARLGETLDVAIAGFATVIAHELVYDHVSGLNLELNRTRRLGIEAEACWAPRRWLEVRADATAVDARFVASGHPVPGAPTVLASAQAVLAHPRGWRGAARLLYLAPRPLAHGAEAATVLVVDASAGRRLGRVDLDLTVDNLLDARWREGEYHFASWFDRSEPRSQIPRIHYIAGEPFTLRVTLSVRF